MAECKKEEKKNKVIKNIISKIFVFIFCVVFINTYNYFCGIENSIVGVILLMGLLMFLKCDFGYDSKYSAVFIPIMFVTMGVLAKVSLISIYLCIPCGIVCIFLPLLFSKGDVTNSAYLPYLMGYLMLRGYNVDGDLFVKRIVSLAIVGIVVGAVHYFANKKLQTGRKIQFEKFSVHNKWEQWCLTLVITLAITMFVGDLFDTQKSMWTNLAVLSLINPIEDEYLHRRIARIPATILGSVLFIVLFGYLIPENYQTAVVLIAGFLSMFITSYFIKTIYNSFSALVTAVLILPMHSAIIYRIVNNIAGAIIAIISIFIFTTIFNHIDKRKELAK